MNDLVAGLLRGLGLSKSQADEGAALVIAGLAVTVVAGVVVSTFLLGAAFVSGFVAYRSTT